MPVDYAVLLTEVDFDQAASTGPGHTAPCVRLVQGPVGGTNQPAPGGIKKTVGLKIHFHGNMGAAVQVGVDLAVKPNRKSPAAEPLVIDIKRNGQAGVDQITRLAQSDTFKWRWHDALSGVVQHPLVQLACGIRDKKRAEGRQGAVVVGTITNAHRSTTGVDRHLQVVGGVAHHQGALG